MSKVAIRPMNRPFPIPLIFVALVGIWILAMLATGSVGFDPSFSPSVARHETADVAELIARHNQQREQHGMAPVRVEGHLQEAAYRHASYMARRGLMRHQGIGDGTPYTRIKDAGYQASLAGENIAMGQPDPASVVSAWMRSPGHRANILNAGYRHIGASIARDGSGNPYWCVVFGSPAGSAGDLVTEAMVESP